MLILLIYKNSNMFFFKGYWQMDEERVTKSYEEMC